MGILLLLLSAQFPAGDTVSRKKVRTSFRPCLQQVEYEREFLQNSKRKVTALTTVVDVADDSASLTGCYRQGSRSLNEWTPTRRRARAHTPATSLPDTQH